MGRFTLLIGIIVASGLLVGFGVAYPLSKLQLSVSTAQSLDHQALAGTFDPEQALVQQGDLPAGYVPLETDLSPFRAIGAQYCGTQPKVDGALDQGMVRSFTTATDGSIVMSEVLRLRQVRAANDYLRQVDQAFTNCAGGSYFRGTGAERVRMQIKPGQPDPPINDYVSYTLRPEGAGKVQRLVLFQIGNVLVAVQFIGNTIPPNELLGKAQQAILERCAPKQFSPQRQVDGVQPLPEDSTTTTAPPVTTTAPPTTAAPATTTTVKKRRPATTTAKPAATAPAAPAATPGQ